VSFAGLGFGNYDLLYLSSERSPAVTTSGRIEITEVGRAAVRAELAARALDLFLHEGYEAVTFNDLAAAVGVSRSTVLRHFGTKEEIVLSTIDTRGHEVADALRMRPAEEDDWTALRRAVDTGVQPYHQDPARALALTRLVQDVRTLRAHGLEKQGGWQSLLAEALAQRSGSSAPPALQHRVWAGAALVCMNAAVQQWSASDGQLDLVTLLDDAFGALAANKG
jgi:AcrR family transcriptional regulator